MRLSNLDDVRRQLLNAGLVLDRELLCDGSIQRWRVEGADRERRGWSRLSEWAGRSGDTFAVGSYGVWAGLDDGRQRINLPRRYKAADAGAAPAPALDAADLAALREATRTARRELDAARKQEAMRAARWAAVVWMRCTPAPDDHEYLRRKQIRPHLARVLPELTTADIGLEMDYGNAWRLHASAGALVAPMHDAHGLVCGLQLIYPRDHAMRTEGRSDKSFWPMGLQLAGCYGVIGPVGRDQVLLLTEGYATAASLHEACGLSVAYGFSAGNLKRAAASLRRIAPRAPLLICADDDYLTDGNPGVTAAAHACAAVERSAWAKPDFADADGNDLRAGRKLTDYNDLHVLTGSGLALARQINARLDELQWRTVTTPAVMPAAQGRGDERRAAAAVLPLDDLVDRYVPLDDGSGKYVWDTWARRVAHREQMLSLLPAGVRADDIKRHPLWVGRGAVYLDEVGFDPSGRDASVKLNTWRGWQMQPRQGECTRLLELLRYLCSEDEKGGEVFEWLLRWMAFPLQNPGAKMHSAVIMHGPQGTGKSTVFQAMTKIYGDYATVLNQRGLEDRFNSDYVDSKLFVLAEEVVTRAEMWHIKNELKELVTGEWVRVNPKNLAAYRQRNRLNIVYLSNEDQPLPLDNDDRRHLVVYTPPELEPSYYDALYREIERGGVEAFYWHLLHQVDCADFHAKARPPHTAAKATLIALSTPSEQRFLHDWGRCLIGLPVCPARSSDVYAAYLRWCKANGELRPRASNQFFSHLARQPGWDKRAERVYDNAHKTGATKTARVVFPPPLLVHADGRAQPAEQSTAAWVTDCVIDFAAALDDEGWASRAVA